jgi:hypothetical protein
MSGMVYASTVPPVVGVTPYDKENDEDQNVRRDRNSISELRLMGERKRGLRMDGCHASIKLSSFVRFLMSSIIG